jgi:hypothetical protein
MDNSQLPTAKKEKQREYYCLQLQFLDIRLQTLTEEMDQLQTQKNQIEVDQKTPSELTLQECDQIISTMTQELKKLKTQEEMYQTYLQNTPDTSEMETSQHHYAQGLRLLQICIKKLQDRLKQAKYGRYLKQTKSDTPALPPAHQVPYPKFTRTYYPDIGYKRNTDLINNMHKIGTEPKRHERKKIIPKIPTYGYVAKHQQKNPKHTPTTTTKSKETKMEPDYSTQKISLAEYVRRNYPRVEGDTPQLLTQLLFRKFNANGVND